MTEIDWIILENKDIPGHLTKAIESMYQNTKIGLGKRRMVQTDRDEVCQVSKTPSDPLGSIRQHF